MLATGSDHLIRDAIASSERTAYEARVAASAPGARGRAAAPVPDPERPSPARRTAV
jgi:hypothetical protein